MKDGVATGVRYGGGGLETETHNMVETGGAGGVYNKVV